MSNCCANKKARKKSKLSCSRFRVKRFFALFLSVFFPFSFPAIKLSSSGTRRATSQWNKPNQSHTRCSGLKKTTFLTEKRVNCYFMRCTWMRTHIMRTLRLAKCQLFVYSYARQWINVHGDVSRYLSFSGMRSISRLVTQRQTSFNLFHTILPRSLRAHSLTMPRRRRRQKLTGKRKTFSISGWKRAKNPFSARDTKIIEKKERERENRLDYYEHVWGIIINLRDRQNKSMA